MSNVLSILEKALRDGCMPAEVGETPLDDRGREILQGVLALVRASGAEDGRDSTQCPTCGDESAVYWEHARSRGVVAVSPAAGESPAPPVQDGVTSHRVAEILDADADWLESEVLAGRLPDCCHAIGERLRASPHDSRGEEKMSTAVLARSADQDEAWREYREAVFALEDVAARKKPVDAGDTSALITARTRLSAAVQELMHLAASQSAAVHTCGDDGDKLVCPRERVALEAILTRKLASAECMGGLPDGECPDHRAVDDWCVRCLAAALLRSPHPEKE